MFLLDMETRFWLDFHSNRSTDQRSRNCISQLHRGTGTHLRCITILGLGLFHLVGMLGSASVGGNLFLSFQKQAVFFFCLFEFSTKNLATALFIAPNKKSCKTPIKPAVFGPGPRRFCGPQKTGIFFFRRPVDH